MRSFDQILGQEDIVLRLRQATQQAGHAYIFEGERGMGKKTLANAFAKALQCEHGAHNGCACLSCRVFDSGNHPDIGYVAAEKTKSIGVDDVREQIIRPMHTKPFRYRYKIFIVDAAETLTVAAQNALLKTIEEPAPYGICMLLTARASALLPTVLSRCVMYRLKPQPDDLVRKRLAEAGVTGEAARYAAAFARGNMGYALEMAASEDFIAMRALAEEVTQQVRQGDLLAAFALYHRFEKWKESIQALLDMLYLCYRDKIVETATGATGATGAAGRQPLRALFEGAEAITGTQRILRQNGNFQMAIEWLLLRLNATGSAGRTEEL